MKRLCAYARFSSGQRTVQNLKKEEDEEEEEQEEKEEDEEDEEEEEEKEGGRGERGSKNPLQGESLSNIINKNSNIHKTRRQAGGLISFLVLDIVFWCERKLLWLIWNILLAVLTAAYSCRAKI